MIKISQDQALKRWGTLPDILKESIFSAYNAEILWRVCGNQHLSEDKIDKIAIITGDVLMGFLHPEDFAQEIHETLNINIEIAKAIAIEIDRKIFSPLKKELEKVYQPRVPEFEGSEEGVSSSVLDLKKKMAEFSFKVIDDEVPQENKIDLSKEVRKENVEAIQVKQIAEETSPVSEESKIKSEITSSLESSVLPTDSMVSIGVAPIAPVTQTTMSPESKSEDQGPLIIHQEVGFKPLSGKLKSLGGMFNFLRDKNEFKKENVPVKAELQFGGEFETIEEKKEEYKPEIKITEEQEKIEKPILDKKENFTEINIGENIAKVVDYTENQAIEPEKKIEEKIEEKNPEIENKKEPKNEETLDLGIFK